MTMRLFKLACLAYKPSDISYRGMVVDRASMISMRRGLVDKITALLPTCDLFSANAIYPRRYFDDLMVDRGIEEQKGLSKLGVAISNHHLIVGSPSHSNFNLNSNSSRILPNLNNIQFGMGNLPSLDISHDNSRMFIHLQEARKHRKNNQSVTIDP